MKDLQPTDNFIFYQSETGQIKIQVIVDDKNETIWASQKAMAEIFGVSKSTISEHLTNIFATGELQQNATVRNFRTVQTEGSRQVKREIEYYNLDAIISVGYRVNSVQATAFRKWATSVLREYMIKGFALDDERLKQQGQLFGKDYFSELLERIREIRASERLFYQKITDIYTTAIDYDAQSPVSQEFFATVQNKLHFAITHQTAAEIIQNRSDPQKENMGLTSWKGQKKGNKILKSDVSIAKNYLTEKELSELNRIVSMYLDYAENQAQRNMKMTMHDWKDKLNAFLQFNEYDLLQNTGTVSAKVAKRIAETNYEQYRIQQDTTYNSDFDRFVKKIRKK